LVLAVNELQALDVKTLGRTLRSPGFEGNLNDLETPGLKKKKKKKTRVVSKRVNTP